MNTISTEHLLLRNWQESDLQELHGFLTNKDIALPAGIDPVKTLEESREYLDKWMNETTRFAVCFHNDPKIIGYIGLRSTDMDSDCASPEDLEIGAWIDVPYWGKGYIPEAVKALEKMAFEQLNCQAIWAAYFTDNEQSRRCFGKCGFTFHHTEENRYMCNLKDFRTEHFTRLTKEEWLERCSRT